MASNNSIARVPLVEKDSYLREVSSFLQREPYDPEIHNGKSNPYTGGKIKSEDDYKRYVREYIYCRKCEQAVERKYSNLIAAQKSEIKAYKRKAADESSRNSSYVRIIKSHNTDMKRVEEWRRRTQWRFIFRSAVFLLALLYVFFGAIPSAKQKAYDKGLSEGKEAGQSYGYEQGYSAGYDKGSLEGKKDGFNEGKEYAYAQASNSYKSGSSLSNKTYSYYSSSYKPSYSNSTSKPQESSTSNSYTVYVSQSGGKIHTRSNCSNMKYYYTMTYAEAISSGYSHCSKCY